MAENSVPLIEVCIDSVESAVTAQAGGAHRVELCDNLLEGGTTPSAGMIAVTRRRLAIGLQVMIRPRGGDFCYSDADFQVMRHDIRVAKSLGADGIVFGILRPDGTVDRARSAALIELARPLNVTFHRAFDVTRDPFAALDDLIALGVDRVLTSGQESSALEGLDLIRELVRVAGGRILVMPGGGVDERNVAKIVDQTGAAEVHVSVRRPVDSAMEYRSTRVFMGGVLRPPEYERMETSLARVQQIVAAIPQDR